MGVENQDILIVVKEDATNRISEHDITEQDDDLRKIHVASQLHQIACILN